MEALVLYCIVVAVAQAAPVVFDFLFVMEKGLVMLLKALGGGGDVAGGGGSEFGCLLLDSRSRSLLRASLVAFFWIVVAHS